MSDSQCAFKGNKMLTNLLTKIIKDERLLGRQLQKQLYLPQWFSEQPDLSGVVVNIIQTAISERNEDGEFGTISVSTTTGLKLSFIWKPHNKLRDTIVIEWKPDPDEVLAVQTYERAKSYYDEPIAVVA